MEVFVGTSGWLYDWNPRGSFDWYVRNSGLNAVELNASFYRFPFPNQVASWARRGKGIRWAVKVHRSITHVRRLSSQAVDIWMKFYELFKPLDPYIDFYLFQLPPTFSNTPRNRERIEMLVRATRLGSRLAIEFRHESWFNSDTIEFCRKLGITVVSIDAPIGTWIATSNGIVYLRMHGRTAWYTHEYVLSELVEIADAVLRLRPSKIYVFFNNDHWMLENARTMLKLLREALAST